jgi:hypothetical protein
MSNDPFALTDYINRIAEIKWLEDRIVALAQEYPKRPSVIHQIEQYRHQIRHTELSLVFRA